VPRFEVGVGVATVCLAAYQAAAVARFFLHFRNTLYYLDEGYFLAIVSIVLLVVPGLGLLHIAWRDHRWLTSYEHVPIKDSEIIIRDTVTRLDSLEGSPHGSRRRPPSPVFRGAGADVELAPRPPKEASPTRVRFDPRCLPPGVV